MSQETNRYGQRVGEPLPEWKPASVPSTDPMRGRYCRLEYLDPARHAPGLHEAFAAEPDERMWTWLPYGPFDTAAAYEDALASLQVPGRTILYAILDGRSGLAVGVAGYLRVNPVMGCLEVGHLRYSPALQRTAAATEAMHLMMRRAFDECGYRRYEWRCHSENEPSFAAAERLGFRFEGTFRQAMVMKGRNRDSSWLSMLDGEWPIVNAAMTRWLDASNFDERGGQRRKLSDCLAEARASRPEVV